MERRAGDREGGVEVGRYVSRRRDQQIERRILILRCNFPRTTVFPRDAYCANLKPFRRRYTPFPRDGLTVQQLASGRYRPLSLS